MMKIRTLLTQSLLAAMLGFSANASAGFDFSSPFDWMDNDDDDYYRYGARDGRGGYGDRGYGRERWRQYDEWEPNYWRYRYFDDDSRDYAFDGFDGDGFGDGRGRFDFDMNMDMDMDSDSRFDGYNDYRNGGRRNFPGFDNGPDFDNVPGFDSVPGFDNDRYSDGGYQRRDRSYDRDYDSYDRRPARRAPDSSGRDQYNDDYWRNYSSRYNTNERRR